MFCTPVSDSSQGILQYTGENFPTLNCIPLPEFPQHDKAPFPQFLSYCVALCAFPIPNCADSLHGPGGGNVAALSPRQKREGRRGGSRWLGWVLPPRHSSYNMPLQHFPIWAIPPPTKREKGRMYLGWD